MCLMSVFKSSNVAVRSTISCISLWKAYFNCVVIIACGFNETHAKKRNAQECGVSFKINFIRTNQELEYFSWDRPILSLTMYKLLLLCISSSSPGIITESPFQFHVLCSVLNPSKVMNQEAASLWWNFSLLEKEYCLWRRDSYLFFTYLRLNHLSHSILFTSFSILYWAQPSFPS